MRTRADAFECLGGVDGIDRGMGPTLTVRGRLRGAVRLGVACPMANEGEAAVTFARAVLQRLDGFHDVRLFAVFDNVCCDGSLEAMRAYADSEPRLEVVWAPENQSVVDAYVRGYRAALDWGADWILEIDAGFSHQPDEIPQFFDAMENGYDCVFGSRFLAGGSILDANFERYLASRGGTILANLLLGTRQTDMTSGFELFTRETLERVLEHGIVSRAHFFQTEIKVFCRDLHFIELPIHYRLTNPRLAQSALNDALTQLWRLFLMRLRGRL